MTAGGEFVQGPVAGAGVFDQAAFLQADQCLAEGFRSGVGVIVWIRSVNRRGRSRSAVMISSVQRYPYSFAVS